MSRERKDRFEEGRLGRDDLERIGAEIAALQDEALDARDDLHTVRSRLLRPPERRADPSRRGLGLAAGGLALAAALALAFLLRPGEPPAPLAFALPSGAPGGSGAFVSAERPEHIAFADGSSLELAAGSDLRFAEVDADGARLDLQRGRVRLDVVHHDAHTRWSVRAGPFEIHVVGTRFAVGWDPETGSFALHMEEGRVELEGPTVDRRVVGAGESVAIDVPDQRMEVVHLDIPPEPEAEPAPSADDAPSPERAHRGRRRAALDWRRLAREGRHREAVDAADWDRLLATAGPAELIVLGDAARFAGENGRAEAAYEAIRLRYPSDGRAAQAAFFLGRLALARGAYGAAAGHFEAAAREAPDGPFAAVAQGRRIEAYEKAGQIGAARQAAEDYLRRWPEGAHAILAHRVIEEVGGATRPRESDDAWRQEGRANAR